MSLRFLQSLNEEYFKKVKEKTGIDLSQKIHFEDKIFKECIYPFIVASFINSIENIVCYNNIHMFSCDVNENDYRLSYSLDDWKTHKFIIASKLFDKETKQYKYITIYIQDAFGNYIEKDEWDINSPVYKYFDAIFEFFKLINDTPCRDLYQID